ncbi:glycosyltransferase [Thalassobacillus sp. CUG 92003]|uniref:glycosyltransferase n=1 Tax=Thalassobacillus sp. CUG 92003 TaxID=2736641 RepID=UPI0015E6F851|nr:glycosyltransferase [Thalassobacillus sp. CUG 92003]
MNKKMLVVSNMYPGKRHTTFGIFVKNQVEKLRERQFDVDVAAIHDPRMSKVHVVKKYLLWLLKTVRILIMKGKSYDVIHAHYVFPSGFLALWFKSLFGTKLVVTAHGGDIDKMPNKGPFFFKQTKKILHKADEIIAVGEGLKRDMIQRFQVDEAKVSVMSMGVDREVFQAKEKQAAQEDLNLAHDRFRFLFVGNYIKEKGLMELLAAFKQVKQHHPESELHFIGSPKQPEFLQEMKQYVQDHEVHDVKIHGPMNQRQVAEWMAAVDVFVLPSYIEGFGLVAVEAMSCGTPVIGSDVGGLSYLLSEGTGRLVTPRDTESLRAAMAEMIKDPAMRSAYRQKGEKLAQKNDMEHLITRLTEIYQ